MRKIMPRFLLVVTEESCSKIITKAACYVSINMTNASVTDAFQKSSNYGKLKAHVNV